MLKPNSDAKTRLAITRAKAKMYEYEVPTGEHINIAGPLEVLIDLTLGILGDLSAGYTTTIEGEEKENLLFSASYFDALFNTRSVDSNMNYLRLLGATAYYLADYPGSSKVLARQISNLELETGNLEKVLLWLLADRDFTLSEVKTYRNLPELREALLIFTQEGTGSSRINDLLQDLRKIAYQDGTDREVLFADMIRAVTLKKLANSTWMTLPRYTGLSLNIWRAYIQRENFVKELWPSQLLLGEHGVLQGKSAVVQMPTSAGKTKSSELLIRSAFLSGRAQSAVIVAPFRALCQEIFNTLIGQFKDDRDVSINIVSDVLQNDFLASSNAEHQILILTPEKLDYLLRHTPEIISGVGLVIYDEGHLFDDPGRGIKFELLLSSLKQRLTSAQIVLISAVMQNSEDIGKWLIGEGAVSVEARDLNPTRRSLAFVSWRTTSAQLIFTNEKDIDQELFFVPRVIESIPLSLRGKERSERKFPAKEGDSYDPSHISIALGYKLVKQGSVAIFTGRKDSVALTLRTAVEANERGYDIPPLTTTTQQEEAIKLVRYIELIYGEDSDYARAARIGLFAHHGSVPHGLRLSTEHALQQRHIKIVVCTSTLSQGVNLPIRYLIITTDRQGADRIKVRDLHNLMGRAGRAGVYTEGTIIFSNPSIFDKKSGYDRWKWDKVKEMLDPSNSELCQSFILQYFEEEPVDIAEKSNWMINREKIRSEISSYLLDATSELIDLEGVSNYLEDLAAGTLAYSQAKEPQKEQLKELFKEIGKEIFEKEPLPQKRQVYAKSIVSIDDAQTIGTLLENRRSAILEEATSFNGLLSELWSILKIFNKNKVFQALTEEKSLALCKQWIEGQGFPVLLGQLSNDKIGNRRANIDHVVDLCENGFGFNNSLILGTCSELLKLIQPEFDQSSLLSLQKMIKYGLPNMTAIALYEMGFSDRILAMRIVETFTNKQPNYTREIVEEIRAHRDAISDIIKLNYPDYFLQKLYDVA